MQPSVKDDKSSHIQVKEVIVPLAIKIIIKIVSQLHYRFEDLLF